MQTSSPPTRRDTFAFVLTIFGAMFWAVFPVSVFFVDQHGVWDHVGIPIVFAVGAFLGAWSGTTLWRHVSKVVPAVAALVPTIMLLAMRGLARDDISATELVSVVATIAGSALGTELGRRAREPQRALVAAWITIGGSILVAASLTLLGQLGYISDDEGILWIAVLAFIPSSVVAARLCRGVRPPSYAMAFFALLFSAFLLVMLASDEKPRDDADEPEPSAGAQFVGSLVLCGIVTGICSIPVRVAFRRHPESADLPTAQVRGR